MTASDESFVRISLRHATPRDARFVWEVNNDASVRAQSISTEPIPWDHHVLWFSRKLADPGSVFFIATLGGAVVGLARFDILGDEATISVAVERASRGKGYGPQIIAAASHELLIARPVTRLVALIRPGNVPSLRAFTRAGYVAAGSGMQRGVMVERFERHHADGRR